MPVSRLPPFEIQKFPMKTFLRPLAVLVPALTLAVASVATVTETVHEKYPLSADGIVHDHVGGREDLKARRVRFIGDAATRIAEDYLRILRFFRFHAY